MYITQVYNTLHDWWRYIIGAGIAIIGVFAFSVPHLVAIGIETIRGNVDESRLEDIDYLMGLFEPNLNLVFILLPFAHKNADYSKRKNRLETCLVRFYILGNNLIRNDNGRLFF